MYDELIAELRQHHCDAKEDDTQEVCEECCYDVIIVDKSAPSGFASVCACGLMNRAADAIEELIRENESLAKSVNEASEILRKRWIPVTERLPRDRQFVLVYCGDNKRIRPSDRFDVAILLGDSIFTSLGVTHWMPLPEPPKEE